MFSIEHVLRVRLPCRSWLLLDRMWTKRATQIVATSDTTIKHRIFFKISLITENIKVIVHVVGIHVISNESTHFP